MLHKTLRHPLINAMMVGGMLCLAMICIFNVPDVVVLKRISSHATQIMLLFVGGGLLFLMLNQQRLLFTSLGCAAALCLHFKYVANISLAPPIKTSERSVTILHASTTDLASDWESTVATMLDRNPDLISVIELTPNWEQLLQQELNSAYPYHTIVTRIDPFGSAIFSKYPILDCDTIYCHDIPHLSSTIEVDEFKTLQVLSSNSTPPLFRSSFEDLRTQLGVLATTVRKSPFPVLTAGNYNLDQFSDELQDFRAQADLADSRKSMSPTINPPTDHLFYTEHFECLSFFNVYDDHSNKVGIMGEYQFKKDAQSTAQRTPEL